mmetsp:Transcript_43120/g.111775  ORF Transcript_43120/g.111775 Transcript_43120/m.111775 type:complete len:187 (-) Transcript_43120:252-812(-)|eukprot:CAMPEP_0113886848 /NCGR_PEP_ID=MMETSP0780_2-20120614/11815_1 /TAXON_ID=652834 /ORGANISM="Palpitomonas bilix" /LENGTH=186 /DNA_ID=CAMNT_0000875173 /DNA_START=33 /DNA_END=593 /DNA_ORIENTATION=+ /assembly_acc=CAM_ASM_000599
MKTVASLILAVFALTCLCCIPTAHADGDDCSVCEADVDKVHDFFFGGLNVLPTLQQQIPPSFCSSEMKGTNSTVISACEASLHDALAVDFKVYESAWPSNLSVCQNQDICQYQWDFCWFCPHITDELSKVDAVASAVNEQTYDYCRTYTGGEVQLKCMIGGKQAATDIGDLIYYFVSSTCKLLGCS